MTSESPKYLIVACGALASEIVFLKRQLRLTDDQVELTCLPAIYHNTPQKIAPAIEAILSEKADDFDRILVAYGECGTAGKLDEILSQYNADRLPGAHCYEFFATSAIFQDIVDEEIGSFFLTDYLVRNFDRLVIRGLGLDKYPHLRATYFNNYKKLIYLAQFEDVDLQAKAKGAAQQLKLQYEYRHVGLGDLETALAGLTQNAERLDASGSQLTGGFDV